MNPLVTVAIPTFNNIETVAETISSLKKQSFTNWICVVSDDSDNDETMNAALIAIAGDSRFSTIKNSHRLGAAGNWNQTLGLTETKYFKLLCADDVLACEALAVEVEALETNEDAVMTCGTRAIINETGKVLLNDRGLRGAPRKISSVESFRKFVLTGTNFFGEPSFVLFRTDALKLSGGFNPDWSYLIDVISYLEVLRTGNLQYVAKNLGSFRVSKSSWSASLTRQQQSETIKALQYAAVIAPNKVNYFAQQVGIFRAVLTSQARKLAFKFLT